MNGRKRTCTLTALWFVGCTGLSGDSTDFERHATASHYPPHWWTLVPRSDAASWEVLPQEARPGEVVLSKRNELGLLSNFARTPFVFRGKRYQSIEGFWQAMKYPAGPTDPRAAFAGITWQYTRAEVSQMIGWEAKAAGKLASENMRRMAIDWVTFEGKRMTYPTTDRGAHYDLIAEATWEKIRQNPEVRDLLLSTGDLVLRPDHRQPPDAPPAWRYHEILMMIREALRERVEYPVGPSREPQRR